MSRFKLALLAGMVVVTVAWIAFPASAALKQWDGSGNNAWGDLNNWTPSGVPASGDDVEYYVAPLPGSGNATYSGLNNNPATPPTERRANSITFNAGITAPYAIRPEGDSTALTLDHFLGIGHANTGDGITVNSTADITLYVDVNLRENQTWTVNESGSLIANSQIREQTTGMTLTKAGTGTLTLGDASTGSPLANTYTGLTTVNAGLLSLNKTAGNNAIAGNLTIGDGIGGAESAIVKLVQDNQIADTAAVVVASDGLFDGNGKAETVGSISGNGVLRLRAGGALTVGNGASKTFSGQIHGGSTSTLTLSAGTLTLSANTLVNPSTFVNQGTLILNKPAGSNRLDSAMTIGDGSGGAETAVVRLDQNEQIRNGVAVTVNSDGLFDGNGKAETVGSISGSGVLRLRAGGTLTIANGAGKTLSGHIGGGPTSTLALNSGTLTLSGNILINPSTSVNGGTLILNKPAGSNWLDSAMTIGDGSGGTETAKMRLDQNEQIDNDVAVTVNSDGLYDGNGKAETVGSISGSGVLRLRAGGALTIANGAGKTLSGEIGGGSTSTLTLNTGTLTLSGNKLVNPSTFVNGGTLILNKSAGSNLLQSAMTIGDAIGGAETAKMRLDQNNQIANGVAVTVNSDGLFDGNGKAETVGSISGSGAIRLRGGGALTIANGAGKTLSGEIGGGGATLTLNAGTLTFNGSTANTYTGATTVNGGLLNLSKTAGTNAIPGNLTVNSGGDVILGAANQVVDSAVVTVNGTGLFRLANHNETIGGLSGDGEVRTGAGGGTLTINGGGGNDFAGSIIGNGRLAKLGLGTQTLSGGNTYTGKTTIGNGSASNRGRIRLGADPVGTVGSITSSPIGTGILEFRAGYLSSDGTTPRVILNDVRGEGGDGNALYLGDATDNGLLTFEGAVTLTHNRGFHTDSDAVFKGDIGGESGHGGVYKRGLATLTFTGDNTYPSVTNVDAGTLLVNGTHTGGAQYTVASGATLGGTGDISALIVVEDGGTLAPGLSIGTINLGALDMDVNSTLLIEIGSPSSLDFVNVAGTAHLDGTIELLFQGGFAPSIGDTFDVLAAGGGITFTPGYGVDSAAITGSSVGFSSTIVDVNGTATLRLQFVPEPATLLVWSLLATCGFAMGWRRRRR